MSQNNTYELGRVGLKLCGDYNAATAYENLDVVQYDGSCYAAKASCTGIAPTNAQYWMLLSKGVSSASDSIAGGERNTVSVNRNQDALVGDTTITVKGTYLVWFEIFYQPNATGKFYATHLHRVRGDQNIEAANHCGYTYSGATSCTISAIMEMEPGDRCYAAIYHNCSAAINVLWRKSIVQLK